MCVADAITMPVSTVKLLDARTSRVRRRVAALVVVTVTIVVAATSLIVGAQRGVPMRIVSTSPSITESLFALGAGDRVVGVSMHCRFPEAVLALPKVGSFLQPDAERIAALRPDLVVVHEVSTGIDRRLAALRIPFIAVDRGTMASVFSSIQQIANAAGLPARGAALVADLQLGLERVRRAQAGHPRVKVLVVIGRRPGALADLIGVGGGTYLNDLIEIAGGTNVLAIAGQPEYPHISLETVIRLDPDVIIDTVDMGDTAAERRARTPINERLWQRHTMLRAVQNRRLYAATTDALVVPGPRVVDAAEWISELLHRAP